MVNLSFITRCSKLVNDGYIHLEGIFNSYKELFELINLGDQFGKRQFEKEMVYEFGEDKYNLDERRTVILKKLESLQLELDRKNNLKNDLVRFSEDAESGTDKTSNQELEDLFEKYDLYTRGYLLNLTGIESKNNVLHNELRKREALMKDLKEAKQLLTLKTKEADNFLTCTSIFDYHSVYIYTYKYKEQIKKLYYSKREDLENTILLLQHYLGEGNYEVLKDRFPELYEILTTPPKENDSIIQKHARNEAGEMYKADALIDFFYALDKNIEDINIKDGNKTQPQWINNPNNANIKLLTLKNLPF